MHCGADTFQDEFVISVFNQVSGPDQIGYGLSDGLPQKCIFPVLKSALQALGESADNRARLYLTAFESDIVVWRHTGIE